MESLWLDSQDHLIALVSVDAEMDHFEAVAEGYEDGLAAFVTGAARDGMANLAKVASSFIADEPAVTAIMGGRLIDGTGKPAVENSVVILRGGKIVAAGPAASISVPKGAEFVDATGKSVLPGLWEMHAHFEQVEWGPIYLATGVTTARDVGNEREFIVAARDAIAAGRRHRAQAGDGGRGGWQRAFLAGRDSRGHAGAGARAGAEIQSRRLSADQNL